VAEKVFDSKGKYKVKILFRNLYSKARLYDGNTGKVKIFDVWTGEMESGEVYVEVNCV